MKRLNSRVRVDETEEEVTTKLMGKNFQACEVLFNTHVLSECPAISVPEGNYDTSVVDFVYLYIIIIYNNI